VSEAGAGPLSIYYAMVYFRFRRATNLCLQVKETPSPG